MIKVFTEYKVKRDCRMEYITLLEELRHYHRKAWDIEDFRIFEGADQPELFVEEFHVQDMERYQKIKEARRIEQNKILERLHDCIDGGAKKVNIWAFVEINE
ncbi:hypothetical protein [Brevibacillus daliensis]|uniref:hypothetical protein n=1 Tax=Brevibacillus daliensis TaxID=2892995 RepID=UPI001E408B95|nr:hypothetical protein [Brevibacillus daliensis]